MGLGVLDAIGDGQAIQAQGNALLVLRPVQTFRAKCIERPDQAKHIPATVALLPLAGIGVVKVAVQAVPYHFVVESEVVVADAAGVGTPQLLVQTLDEVPLAQPQALQGGGQDTGDQAGCRMGQDVLAQLAMQIERCFDFVEVQIGTHPGHLQRTIPPWIDARGLEVVPEDTLRHTALP